MRRFAIVPLFLVACSSKGEATLDDAAPEVVVPGVDVGTDRPRPDAGVDATLDAAEDAARDAPGDDGAPPPSCPTTFAFRSAEAMTNVRIAGEWTGFDLAKSTPMVAEGTSGYRATVALPPGLHAYKIVYEQGGTTRWVLDPGQQRRKFVGAVENSAVKVRDCRLPSLTVVEAKATRAAPGSGAYTVTLEFVDGVEASGPDATFHVASLERDGAAVPVASSVAGGRVTLSATGLADGKYRLTVTPRAKNGRVGEPVRLPFWVEAEAFSWKDAVVYMIVTDRYRNGDPTNDPAPSPGADPRGDFEGGDLEGVRRSIADGTLDKLGIRALWLTPFGTNPSGGFLAADEVHRVTGYHGYWPIKGREVDPRLGGSKALAALVKEAHAHGIRILQDFVVNHVHKDHEYFAAHPEWFRDGCVCGTAGCDWTARALDCKFASYLPDINHAVPEANARFVADAVWWLDTFDLDGLRVDAVKHVEEVATRNLAAEVREGFERSGLKHFLMGETAMGWSDCADPCNDENYGTIAKYIGQAGLDGQFDFVLYHGVSYKTFAYGDQGMLHADYWTRHGLSKWPTDAIMTPYIGSHDTPRFSTLADYRGQDAAHDRGVPGNQWSSTAVAPKDGEPYARARIALAWLLGLPGAPLLYYGDEYGQWGGSDPNNRLFWRDESKLSADELATLAFTRKVGLARKALPPMRRGAYVGLPSTNDVLVFGRKIAPGDAAVVVVSRAGSPQTTTFDVASSLGLSPGTVLKDALGGPGATVDASGKLTVVAPARGAAILAK